MIHPPTEKYLARKTLPKDPVPMLSSILRSIPFTPRNATCKGGAGRRATYSPLTPVPLVMHA